MDEILAWRFARPEADGSFTLHDRNLYHNYRYKKQLKPDHNVTLTGPNIIDGEIVPNKNGLHAYTKPLAAAISQPMGHAKLLRVKLSGNVQDIGWSETYTSYVARQMDVLWAADAENVIYGFIAVAVDEYLANEVKAGRPPHEDIYTLAETCKAYRRGEGTKTQLKSAMKNAENYTGVPEPINHSKPMSADEFISRRMAFAPVMRFYQAVEDIEKHDNGNCKKNPIWFGISALADIVEDASWNALWLNAGSHKSENKAFGDMKISMSDDYNARLNNLFLTLSPV